MISTVLPLIGYGMMLIGGILLLIAAFKESVLWGVFSLLLPIVLFFFIFTHWSESKKGFSVWILGLGVFILSTLFR